MLIDSLQSSHWYKSFPGIRGDNFCLDLPLFIVRPDNIKLLDVRDHITPLPLCFPAKFNVTKCAVVSIFVMLECALYTLDVSWKDNWLSDIKEI